ncbi:MAG: response regulator, partial [Gemmatimonadota bacterium]|nr:response regulator [Gemmatimonadota bacterium]
MALHDAASESVSGISLGRERKVLVVEDSPLQRRILAEHLRALGFAVRVEPDAAGALASLAETRPDAVVCDVVLPTLDGFALCRTIRADEDLAEVPVVLVTSTDVEESDHLLARRSGASALVDRQPGYGAVVEAVIGALERTAEGSETRVDTLADLRQPFLVEGRREARELRSAAPDLDWTTLRRVGHRWIGRAGVLGFPAIADRARALEEAASERDATRVAAALETLIRLFDGAHTVASERFDPAISDR